MSHFFPLPPPQMRWGVPRMQDDVAYTKTARMMANAMISDCGISSLSSVLDIGCGQGRMLRGLVDQLGTLQRYVGIDVHDESIRWLKQNCPFLFAEFYFVNYKNERYNPDGSEESLPENIGLFDIVCLISVFSHMRQSDIKTYLAFINEHLSPGASVYITLFVEDGVPDETENPEGYFGRNAGPLHRVRYNRHFFERMVSELGFYVNLFRYSVHEQQQSIYILRKID